MTKGENGLEAMLSTVRTLTSVCMGCTFCHPVIQPLVNLVLFIYFVFFKGISQYFSLMNLLHVVNGAVSFNLSYFLTYLPLSSLFLRTK